MNSKDYMDIILGVITDFRVIGTVVVMILVIEWAKFVASYKKRPPKPKKKKGEKKAATATEPAAAPAEGGDGNSSSDKAAPAPAAEA